MMIKEARRMIKEEKSNVLLQQSFLAQRASGSFYGEADELADERILL